MPGGGGSGGWLKWDHKTLVKLPTLICQHGTNRTFVMVLNRVWNIYLRRITRKSHLRGRPDFSSRCQHNKIRRRRNLRHRFFIIRRWLISCIGRGNGKRFWRVLTSTSHRIKRLYLNTQTVIDYVCSFVWILIVSVVWFHRFQSMITSLSEQNKID